MSVDPQADKIFNSVGSLFRLAISLEKDSFVGRLNALTVILALVLSAVLSASPLLEILGNFVLAYRNGASQMAESTPFDFSVFIWWFLFMAACMVMVTVSHILTEKNFRSESGVRKREKDRKKNKKNKKDK